MPKAIGYIRASTNKQVDTLAAQKDKITKIHAAAYKESHPELLLIEEKEAVSAGVAFTSRPQGFEVDKLLEAGDVLIVTKLDRGFRSMRDLVCTMDDWSKRGVRVCLLDLNVDTGTPLGKMMLYIFGMFAEFERARISERTKEAADQRRREGRVVGGICPYGYKYSKRKNGKYKIPNYEERKIGLIFLQWYESGMSLEKCVVETWRQRIPFRGGGKWNQKAMRLVLKRAPAWREQERLKKLEEEANGKQTNPFPTQNGSVPHG